jgi:demethylmenaquinone methyltransferase/2-methoxy-6-polyprenyl-1,4-benzoquinol methylase
MALGSGSWYRRRALVTAGLRAGMSVLDIGTGTGLLACEAAAIVADPRLVTGIDPSAGMVRHAKVPAGLKLIAGSAESIPADAASCDFLCMGYALRHVADLTEAFAEFFRVLRPGGRLCLLEITQPTGAIAKSMLRFYMRGIVPAAAAIVARHGNTPELMRYYWDTIAMCVPPDVILASMRNAGFAGVERRVELGIFSEYQATKPG